RLEHHGTAYGDCGSDLVRDLVQRMVEGGNCRDELERFAQGISASPTPVRGHVEGEALPVVAQRLGGRESQYVEGARHLVSRVLEAQARLPRNEAADEVCFGFDPRSGAQKQLRAVVTWQLAP